MKCALKGGKHHSHDYKETDDAFKKYQAEMTASLEPMEKQVATLQRVLAQLDAGCGELADQRAATEDEIHVSFRRLAGGAQCEGDPAHRPAPPNHSTEAEGAGSPEGPA